MAVTSASLGEGKTSVVTNVAAAFSRAGHRVAVVDADLRRPCVATFFGLNPERGLTDVLAGTCSLGEALNVLDDGRLAVLTSGARPDNPSEALASAGMKQVLRQLADDYDYVFVDTPPVLPVSDPLVVAPLVDGVIVVIRLGRTTRDRMQRASKALERVNATTLGVVPNMSGKGRDRDYRYPYRYASLRGRKDVSASLPVLVSNGHTGTEVRGH
jgi:capsular exopolysaccharide synthesis family protein